MQPNRLFSSVSAPRMMSPLRRAMAARGHDLAECRAQPEGGGGGLRRPKIVRDVGFVDPCRVFGRVFTGWPARMPGVS